MTLEDVSCELIFTIKALRELRYMLPLILIFSCLRYFEVYQSGNEAKYSLTNGFIDLEMLSVKKLINNP
ncbi:hypothetical protein PJIAN_3248 [Paludibacter jiangxiensis]|uniref:Uncharacterized protein n=1 Tax=Paludibacter jiangxiensis TaxID=681398 RepID=A0A170ZRB4_9BACT|nr:hypothetical protein PJIAN_3248 [Paludibacter jiangxiensis]